MDIDGHLILFGLAVLIFCIADALYESAMVRSRYRRRIEFLKAIEIKIRSRHGLGTYSDGMVKLGYRSGSVSDA